MTDKTKKCPDEVVSDLAAPQVPDEKSAEIRGGFLGGLITPVKKTVGTPTQSPARTG